MSFAKGAEQAFTGTGRDIDTYLAEYHRLVCKPGAGHVVRDGADDARLKRLCQESEHILAFGPTRCLRR
ncbi:MAG: hypothetical protein ACYC0V_00025 [Armatimonadota bacterium]